MASEDTYVELPMQIDEQAIVDAAVLRLQARWPGWTPNDGDMEVAILEEGGSMAAALGYIAARMPAGALAQFGLKLYGIPFSQGSPAETTITLTVADLNGPYTIPAGCQLNIDGYAFSVFQDTIVPNGTLTVAGVQTYCAVNASAANGLRGDILAQLSLPSFVTAVTVDRPTDGGTDPQTVTDYLNAFSSELRLRAKTIVTTRDFETEGLNFNAEIGRIQAVGNTARLVTVTVATSAGGIVSTPTKTALAAHYTQYALVNTTFTINDPTYTTINAAWTVKMLPGAAFDSTSLTTLINAALTAALSPQAFNAPMSGQPGTTTGWIADAKIYRNDLIALVKSLPGVLHVIDITLSATGLTVDGAGNLTMTGLSPLPQPGIISGVVS